jgi:hypothetical protein
MSSICPNLVGGKQIPTFLNPSYKMPWQRCCLKDWARNLRPPCLNVARIVFGGRHPHGRSVVGWGHQIIDEK